MIQKNRRSDSIVTNFYFTEPAWRLLQHNPPESGQFSRPLSKSALCRFCCRSPLMAFANGDSVALTRFAAEASDDGAAEARAGAAFLRVSARRGDTPRSPCARDRRRARSDLGAC